ncbi:Cell wall beta-glucan synthesis [Penicillium roqueforti FM164]|uniref:Cell wall beta-glucan synthesis n=1 Tax=Penicillium roqueforti (strain FM164) TaxID=1365484 RepID=W6Q592_PENRF|nr:Cell wall beta-glucan synthesis [Penicillium roqueforti FM164]
MMRFVISLVVSLASLVAAIEITSPAANTTYAAGSTVNVEWTSVDTDPTNFSLYLWNFVSWPPSYVPLAIDVPTSDLSYSVQIPCETTPDWGYQISGINGTNVYIIYAQGEKFTVDNADNSTACVDTPLPTTSICPNAAASTVYVTPGIVPKTIGWCSDYSHPVTLDKVPAPTPTLSAPNDTNGSDASPVFTAALDQVTDSPGILTLTITNTATVLACPNVHTI